MKYFTAEEIFRSIVSALIYGTFFEILCIIIYSFCTLISELISLPRKVFFYGGKLMSSPYATVADNNSPTRVRGAGAFVLIVKVLLFSLGFLLLSYYSLDGVIRAYLLLLSLSSLYLVRNLIRPIAIHAFSTILRWLLSFLIIVLRTVTYPVRILVVCVWHSRWVYELYEFITRATMKKGIKKIEKHVRQNLTRRKGNNLG